MKKDLLFTIGIIFLLFLSGNAFCQNSSTRICDPTQQSSGQLPQLVLVDGFPFASNKLLSDLDPQTIMSISIKNRDTIHDYSGRPVALGLIIVTSKDSLNKGLKYILKKTNGWIYSHPLAEFRLNGKTMGQDAKEIYELSQLDPSQVATIKISEPEKKNTKYKNGALLIKTK